MKDVPQSKHQIKEKDPMIKDVMQKLVSTVTFAVIDGTSGIGSQDPIPTQEKGQDDQDKKFHELKYQEFGDQETSSRIIHHDLSKFHPIVQEDICLLQQLWSDVNDKRTYKVVVVSKDDIEANFTKYFPSVRIIFFFF